jgi:DNA polymerase-3 subunit gamma/tau
VATPSLYRRYRPQRFAELKGQDHVVRALRDAVAGGREGQAYLFSGPRGTGKTSSARILAKVLNCERPVEGEPCGTCESCRSVERGISYDVHELDAASNNGVDAMRDLIEKASLGTPGRHKVYILDEVHMLSKAAEAALLKTLEEPPPHVVFVLATTDPQKVSETIRSRTQHLRFHLLPPDVLGEYVRWVAADAGLDVSEAAIDAALAEGGGSARDTLSALELLVNGGDVVGEAIELDEFLDALGDHDPGRALTAMARAVNAGHDPRTIAEELVRHLRNGFLALMAPELVQLPAHQVEAIAERARRLGAAPLVRAVELLGTMLVELRHAPDPRVLIEVALVQLTHDPGTGAAAAGGDHLDELTALAGRVTRLEQALAAASASTPATPVDPTTGRVTLGGRARRTAGHEPEAPPAEPEAPAVAAATATADRALWESAIRTSLKGRARALFMAVEFAGTSGGVVQLVAPNGPTREMCEQHRGDVEAAFAAAGAPARIELVVDGEPVAPPPGPDAPVDEEPIDPDELIDAPPGTAPSALERITQAFPGAQLVEDHD